MHLSQELANLLLEISNKHAVSLQRESILSGLVDLDAETRERLIDALSSELCDTGLFNDDEPNGRGLRIEELIDWVNRN